MKYVVLRVTDHATKDGDEDTIHEVPVVFPEQLIHREMAAAVTRLLRSGRPDGRHRGIEPVSAGFLSSMAFDLTQEFCYGKSESLGVVSRPMDDSRLITTYDYKHGIVSW